MACLLLAKSAYRSPSARLSRMAEAPLGKSRTESSHPALRPGLTANNLNLNRNRPQSIAETGSTTIRTEGSDHADTVRSVRTTAGISAGDRRVPVQRLARVGIERRRRLSAD